MNEKTKKNTIFEEIVDKDAFLSGLRPAKSISVSRDLSDVGIISIFNSKGIRKRISLSAKLLENLNNPKKVMIAFKVDHLLIGENIPESVGTFTVRESGNKGMLYAGDLVKEITKEFELDFSNRTGITCYEVKYLLLDGNPIASINLKDSNDSVL